MTTNTAAVLLIVGLTAMVSTSDARDANCEHVFVGILHCSHILESSRDYFKSFQTMVPKFLQEAALNQPGLDFLFSSSDLFDVPDGIFEGFNMTNLNFIGNTFGVFPPEFLMHVSSDVEDLHVKDNTVGFFLRNRFFDELPFASTMKTLTLEHCEIILLKPYAFSRFTSLQKLDLSHNHLVHVASHEFANHPTLTSINLSNNKLMQLEEEAFENLPNLRTLDLSSNLMVVLPARAFSELGSLRTLNLCDNFILSIEDSFDEEDFPKLYDLQLAENPFLCLCSNAWFKNWLLKRDMLDTSDVICYNKHETPIQEVDFC